MGALVEALEADLRAHEVPFEPVGAVGIQRAGSRWEVTLSDGGRVVAASVVLAGPAGVSAALVAPHAARAGALLAAIPYASVALVALAVPRDGIERELDGSGFLVPRTERRTVTACSWTSAKWPHLHGSGTVWLRASVGRDGQAGGLDADDDALVAAVTGDLAETMALRGPVAETRVTRWPDSFPQYRPGHLDACDRIDADLRSSMPGVVIAGAAMRGLGVPACIRPARHAASEILSRR